MPPPKLSLVEQLGCSTLRFQRKVGKDEAGKDKHKTATGFFFGLIQNDDGTRITVLVSNRHAADGTDATLFCNEENPDGTRGAPLRIKLKDFEKRWILHPKKEVDLAILPMGNYFSDVQATGKKVHRINLHFDIVADQARLDQLSQCEDIVMVGYPHGLADLTNNDPIFRKGIAATHPAKPFDNRPEFLVDIAVYPGNSGSPVLLYNPNGWINKNGSTQLGSSRLWLLGILRGVWEQPVEGKGRIIQEPADHSVTWIQKVGVNLGVAVRAELLKDFVPIVEEILKEQK